LSLVDRSRGLQVYLLPFAFDDSPANLRRCLMLFVLSIRVINLLQAGGALRSVRVLKATVKTVVAHAVAIAIARLLMQYGRNPGVAKIAQPAGETKKRGLEAAPFNSEMQS